VTQIFKTFTIESKLKEHSSHATEEVII